MIRISRFIEIASILGIAPTVRKTSSLGLTPRRLDRAVGAKGRSTIKSFGCLVRVIVQVAT
jgi:hypothetical protein